MGQWAASSARACCRCASTPRIGSALKCSSGAAKALPLAGWPAGRSGQCCRRRCPGSSPVATRRLQLQQASRGGGTGTWHMARAGWCRGSGRRGRSPRALDQPALASSQSSSSLWRTGLTKDLGGNAQGVVHAPRQRRWPTRWPHAARCGAAAHGAHAAQGLPAVNAGHGQVQQHHVGPQGRRPPSPARRGRWRRCASRSPAGCQQLTSTPRSASSLSTTSIVRRAPRVAAPLAGCGRCAGNGAHRWPAACISAAETAAPRNTEPSPGWRAAGELATHQVGEHLGDRSAPSPSRRPAAAHWPPAPLRRSGRHDRPRRERLEHALQLVRPTCPARCHAPRCAPSRAHSAGYIRTAPRWVNLMALPTRLNTIWRSRLSSPRTQRGHRCPAPRSRKAKPFSARLQLKHGGGVCHGTRQRPWAWGRG